MLVREYLGKKSVKGDVGLELEVEATRPLPDVAGIWGAKGDGSLRGYGMEYVTNGAVEISKVGDYCRKLTDHISKSNPDPDSPRTSFHVHVNVLEHTMVEAATAMCCYWLLDNVMTKFCGPDREGNVFCLRLKDAENVIKVVAKSFKDTGRPFRHIGGNIRYSSQNIFAMAQLGTLEYRNMRGTLDPEVMAEWATALHKIVNRAKEYRSPDRLLDTVYEDRGYERFLNSMVGYDFAKKLKCDGWDEMIEENVGIVMELAYSQDWDKWQKQIAKGVKPQFADPMGVAVANDNGEVIQNGDNLMLDEILRQHRDVFRVRVDQPAQPAAVNAQPVRGQRRINRAGRLQQFDGHMWRYV